MRFYCAAVAVAVNAAAAFVRLLKMLLLLLYGSLQFLENILWNTERGGWVSLPCTIALSAEQRLEQVWLHFNTTSSNVIIVVRRRLLDDVDVWYCSYT